MKGGIEFVYAPYDAKWGIVFHSKEDIIASCEYMCICGGSGSDSRYPPYERLVKKSGSMDYLILEHRVKDPSKYEYVKVGNYYLYSGLEKEEIKGILSCETN